MGKSRKRRKSKSRFSLDRGLVSVVLSIVSLTVLGTALIAESALLLVVSGLSALATVLQVRWSQQRARAELKKEAAKPRARRSKPNAAAPPAEKPTTGPGAAGGGLVLCTDTSKPVESCECASRHVATAEGARRYGLPVGSPMGRRAKKDRPVTTVHRNA